MLYLKEAYEDLEERDGSLGLYNELRTTGEKAFVKKKHKSCQTLGYKEESI